MSEKTDAFVPKFYLYHPEQPMCITKPMIIGRTMGDVVLENSTLSSKHCAFIPRLLALYVMDLESSNGVFVNKQKIFPHEEVKVAAGDEVVIGDMSFLVFDNEEKYKLHILKEKSLTQKPEKSFQISDLVTFFHVSMKWRAFYTFAIVSSCVSILVHSRLGIPLGDELKFLNETYTEFLILYGIRSILIVWGVCLLHAFLVKQFFNRHKFYAAMSILPLLGTFFFSSNIYYGPAGFLKQYAEIRYHIEEPTQESAPINQLKKLTQSQEMLEKNFSKIMKKLNADQKKFLKLTKIDYLQRSQIKLKKLKSNSEF